MPAKDAYHAIFRRALELDGWTVTHDPYTLSVGGRSVYVDLGAERLLAAERGKEKIAAEVKTFGGPSELANLESALGQYVLYHSLLQRIEPERKLVLAVPEVAFHAVFQEPIARPVLEDLHLRLVRFDPVKEKITQWMID